MTLLSAAALFPAGGAEAQAPAPTTAADDRSVLAAARDESDRMTVPVMINGQGPFAFIVDTASDRTTVSQTLAASLNLPSIGSLNVNSATGLNVVPGVRIDRLQVGPREIRAVEAPVFLQSDIGAAGLLGIDALADQNIVIDFLAKQMTIQHSSDRDEPGDIIVKGKSLYGQLVLVDASVSGRDLFVVIDTGGLVVENPSVIEAQMRQQAERAVAEADRLVFMVDARAGLTAQDEIIARELRRSGKPIILAVNKIESLDAQVALSDFHALGLGQPLPIAATHGQGISELLAEVLARNVWRGAAQPDAAARLARLVLAEDSHLAGQDPLALGRGEVAFLPPDSVP